MDVAFAISATCNIHEQTGTIATRTNVPTIKLHPCWISTSDNVWGRGTLVHEFGHAIGLGHENVLSMMKAAAPLPLIGGTSETADLYPDDIRGLRTMYGIAFSYANIAASPYRVNPYPQGAIQKNQLIGTSSVARGMTISRVFTVLNQSTTDATLDQFWYLRLNGTGPYIQIASNTANWVEHENYWNFTRNLTFPSTLTPGTYTLVHWVVLSGSDARFSDNMHVTSEAFNVNP